MARDIVALIMNTKLPVRENLTVVNTNGQLPSYCKCKGFLDFISPSVLKCRECGDEIIIDNIMNEFDSENQESQ